MEQEKIKELSRLLPEKTSMTKFFHSVVSNPPYQMTSISNKVQQGRDTEVSNIFHFFYEISTFITECSTMIFPGGRWMQRSHGNNSISNLIFSTVHEIKWFPNGEERNISPVFDNVAISDGVSIVYFHEDFQNDTKISVNGYELERPKDKEIIPLSAEANSIISKINGWNTLHSRKLDTNIFKLGTNWVENNMSQVVDYDKHRIKPHDEVIAYLGNDTPGKNKRVQKYFLKKDSVEWTAHLNDVYASWKIVCSQGQVSKRPATSSYRIIENNTVIGASWLILGIFKTEEEAINYKKYIDTAFVRFLIEESRGGKSGKWGIFVPDLINYTSSNSYINWNEKIDEQLFDLFQLSNGQRNTIMSKDFHWKDKNQD